MRKITRFPKDGMAKNRLFSDRLFLPDNWTDIINCSGFVTATGRTFGNCYVDNSKKLSLSFDGCQFKTLKIKNSEVFLRMINCEVGELDFCDSVLNNLKVVDCEIGQYYNYYSTCRDHNFSGSPGMFDSATGFLLANFKRDPDGRGLIVYKAIGNTDYPAPSYWKIEPGSVIEEVVDLNRDQTCSFGVNFGTQNYLEDYHGEQLWECLLKWEDLADTVVPVRSDGKCRCHRLTLLRTV